jgi:hypothetical protein
MDRVSIGRPLEKKEKEKERITVIPGHEFPVYEMDDVDFLLRAVAIRAQITFTANDSEAYIPKGTEDLHDIEKWESEANEEKEDLEGDDDGDGREAYGRISIFLYDDIDCVTQTVGGDDDYDGPHECPSRMKRCISFPFGDGMPGTEFQECEFCFLSCPAIRLKNRAGNLRLFVNDEDVRRIGKEKLQESLQQIVAKLHDENRLPKDFPFE